ncbi:hypothetical protein BegalDRAFT_1614 [Beggiatoa alba B18LD]|uniref:Uncharacterized protein n=1 Tax=Beggiatoa alba B18LD TaxID=395493 RepID=I3CFV0_9GAMM|nr:hypothetical protein [Beggiatoa alba]EIJ42491.1 hypothetical protein BegalDRAFT_1612 [Beggiatoa alba B18LD]EIJ42493.1 hypothetical protein BegalDRAFT_1614 [Beggiatoa alba B18LD]
MTFSLWHIAESDKVARPVGEIGNKQVVFDSLALAQDFIQLLPEATMKGVIVIIDDDKEEIVHAEDWQTLCAWMKSEGNK